MEPWISARASALKSASTMESAAMIEICTRVIERVVISEDSSGDTTGIATESCSTTTPTYPTAESSLITTRSITRVQISIMAADSMVEADFRAEARAEIQGSMDQPHSMDL